MFAYTLGCLIVITSYSLEPILACLHRRRKYRQYAYLEWVTNETLQLHRVAHERPNEVVRTWSRCTGWVPTTAPGVLLSSLDISNLKHPRLPSKDQDSIASSLDTSEDNTAPPEGVGCGGSNPEPDCNNAQQPETAQEVVNTDPESSQAYVSDMTAVILNPNDELQVTQIPIPSQAIEDPSPLEGTPRQHVPRSTLQTRPEQMPAFDHGRMLSPHSFPIVITERERGVVAGSGSAMGNFL